MAIIIRPPVAQCGTSSSSVSFDDFRYHTGQTPARSFEFLNFSGQHSRKHLLQFSRFFTKNALSLPLCNVSSAVGYAAEAGSKIHSKSLRTILENFGNRCNARLAVSSVSAPPEVLRPPWESSAVEKQPNDSRAKHLESFLTVEQSSRSAVDPRIKPIWVHRAR